MAPLSAVPEPRAADEQRFRYEALRAFVHEVRTPLTSIRMVLALGQREAEGGAITLDAELARMLQMAVDDLQTLTDDMQEMSRIERNKAALSRGPSELAEVVEVARGALPPGLALEGSVIAVAGPWDLVRLGRAVAGLAQGANRLGDGSGAVRIECEAEPQRLTLTLSSGASSGDGGETGAEAGYAFFRARMMILALRGTVECDRGERSCRIRVALPR